jgi:hypothetical protein
LSSIRPLKLHPLPSRSFAYLFLAFVVPLLVRAIPEALMGNYVVGFDTMAHYVPTTLQWMRGVVTFSSFVGTAPLFYSIVVLLVSSGGSLLLVLKVISVFFEGFLGLSIYGYAKKGLGWSNRKSLATALLGTLNFVALRVSMDSLRNMLGLTFFFVVLTLFTVAERNGNSRKVYALLSLSMIAVVLSHQLVSVIMLGILAFTIAYKFLRKEKTKALRFILVSLPAALIFLAMVFLVSSVSEFRLIFGFPNTNDGWLSLFGFSSYPSMLFTEAGFFIYCFLPILPFLLLGIWRFKNFELRSWLVVSLILLFVPMVSPGNLRWELMLIYPLAFFAVEGLSRLKSNSWNHFGLTLRKIGVIYLVLMVSVLSLGFMLMTSQNPFPYFDEHANGYIYQIPTSMQQNTVSRADCPDTLNALQWFKNNADRNAVLLTHRAFYGWAMLSVDARQIMLYEYDNPTNAANTALQKGNTKIYLIWWIKEQGWYGQPNTPTSFSEVYHSGEIAIYLYEVP